MPIPSLFLALAALSAAPVAALESPSGRSLRDSDFSDGTGVAARYVLVRYRPERLSAIRAALGAARAQEVAVVTPGLLLVERNGGAAGEVFAAADGVTPFLPEDRISRELSAGEALPTTSVLLIHLMPRASEGRVTELARRRANPIVASGQASGFGRVVIEVPGGEAAAFARELAGLEEVFFVERIRRVGLLNDRSGGTMQTGVQGATPAVTPYWAAGIRGEGQIVGEIDTGTDPDSCFFRETNGVLPPTNTWAAGVYGTAVDLSRRKILAYDFLFSCDQYAVAGCDAPASPTAWDNQGHGTHVGGNMTADNLANLLVHDAADGMAPAAKFVPQDGGYGGQDACADLPGIGCPVISLGPVFAQAYAQGVRIHNNSWGDNENAASPGQSNYTARSRDVDDFVWSNPEMLIVFAAGNSGTSNVDFSVGSPGTAKNSISVGGTRRTSTGSDEDMATFSSRGWTGDGRIKPDVMAPANNTSAGSDGNTGTQNCGTDTGGGTSYSAPTLAGTAALARQFFTEGFSAGGVSAPDSGFVPSAALLKAVLVNSAVAMTGRDNASASAGTISPIPSNEQGWGRVRLDRALPLAGATRKLFVHDQRIPLASGATAPFTYTFSSVEASEPLEVTLAWTDYPATADSAPANPTVLNSNSWSAPRLVNDLDLTVSGPSGTYRGNVYSAGSSITGGSADRRNNVESVLIPAPAAGTWTVTVTPFAIVQSGQQLALAVTGRWGSVADCRPGAPQAVSASYASGSATVTWSGGAPAGDSYRIWRASGGCVEGPFTLVGTSLASPFVDTGLSDGTTYLYRVSALSADGLCDSPPSACAVAACASAPPVFAGAAAAVSDTSGSCGVTVSWAAAAASCPKGSLVYDVYRDSSASFTPSASSRIASCVPGTSFHDESLLVNGQPAYYVVRAEDPRMPGSGGCSGGLSDSNLVRIAVTPVGSPTVLFSDGFESWPGPWTPGTFSQDLAQFRGGAASARSANVDQACSLLRTTASLALPAGTSPVLRYSAFWNIETGYDGATVEISTAAAGPFTRLTPTPGYPGSRNTTAGTNCLAVTTPCYTGSGGWVEASASLAAWAGQNVYLQFRYSSDTGQNNGGFWVDDVSVSVAGACATLVDEVSAGEPPLLVVKEGAALRTTFERMPGAALYNVYEGALGAFYSHGGAGGNACAATVTDLGDGSARADVNPTEGDRYYLVTAAAGGTEGPAGSATGGTEIPAAESTCAP